MPRHDTLREVFHVLARDRTKAVLRHGRPQPSGIEMVEHTFKAKEDKAVRSHIAVISSARASVQARDLVRFVCITIAFSVARSDEYRAQGLRSRLVISSTFYT